MKLIAPDYYARFRCIADRCRHSCCVGWEIDVDPQARARYRSVPGAFGERLNAAIDDSGETACFRLDADERCPMLNKSGLCDLITELGEDALCQICADHPRFRSFFEDRTEIGLGMCCEAAAALILDREEPVRLVILEDDGAQEALPEDEAALLEARDRLIALVQNRTKPVAKRLDDLLEAVDFALPERNWAAVYRDLERLDPAWDAMLNVLERTGLTAAEQPELETAFEQLAAYLLYRHLPGALEDDDLPGRAAFCVLSARVVMALCAAKPGCTPSDCAEYARMYSAEIEYSQDNIAALLDALWEE